MGDERLIGPGRVQGTIKAPASKSAMLRAVAAAYLTGAECELLSPSFCDDALAALRIVEGLGTRLTREAERVSFSPGGRDPDSVLDCGESGLCIRMFPSIVALGSVTTTLTGHGSLSSRPLGMVEGPLRSLGVDCRTQHGVLPVTVRGPMRAGKAVVDGSTTSQFLTGLLMALPLCEGDSEIEVVDLTSRPYIEMTLHVLAAFGIRVRNDGFERFRVSGPQRYNPIAYHVEGDWSGAAFPLVAGAIAGNARVGNLDLDSHQADKAIVEALVQAGAVVETNGKHVRVTSSALKGFTFDATNCPDLFPPLVALACCCEGRTILHGAQRLKVKESDRGCALLSEFQQIGAVVSLHDDRMEVVGGRELAGGAIDSHNDHRIAMAGAVIALRTRDGVRIRDWQCVAKSYPGFFDALAQLTSRS